MNEPGGLSYDGLDYLYIADTNNHCIQKLNIDTYEMTKLDLEMPKSAESSEEEVDSSKASLVFKVSECIIECSFSNFSCMFLNPNIFSNLNYDCSDLLDMRNLQEQVEKACCYQKLF